MKIALTWPAGRLPVAAALAAAAVVLRALGRGWALALRPGPERRKVALTNLRLCFPEKTEAEREGIARRHFVAFAQAVLTAPGLVGHRESGCNASSASRVSSI